jgi:hypothetical protein
MTARQRTSRIGIILREPTLHFALLAAALFGVNAAVGALEPDNVLEIDRAEIATRIARAEAGAGRPLSPAERKQVEESYIDEQVLVREAQAMGLTDDAQIRDLLALKMLHVLSADVIQPTDAELRAYYDENRTRYAPLATVTVDELVIGSSVPLPPRLRVQLERGLPPGEISSEMPVRSGVLNATTLADLTALFGEAAAAAIFGAEPGAWVGPHESIRGQHWFRVTSRTGSAVPPLDSLRERVRLDWVTEREATRLQQRVIELREAYTLVYTGEGEGP